MDEIDKILAEVKNELTKVVNIHKSIRSPHEGVSLIREEFEELWDEVKKCKSFDDVRPGMGTECIQIAAMAVRFIYDLIPIDNLSWWKSVS